MKATSHPTNMHQNTKFLILVAGAVMVSGCDRNRTTSQQLNTIETRTAETSEQIENRTASDKDEFVRAERAELAEINRDLDELAADIERSSAPVKDEAMARIEALRERTARLNARLDEAANVTESNWDEFKADVREARTESVGEFNKARQWLGETITP